MALHSRYAALVVAVGLAAGCAGYAGDVQEIRTALLAGDQPKALDRANGALEVGEPDAYPMDVGGNTALLVLERGTVKQALGQYASAALDFGVADKNLEVLDLKNDTAGNIGKWLFSDSVTVYKAPPHEKLLLNTLNLLNYLALGDLEGARVEARRFALARRLVEEAYSAAEAQIGLADYLSGFVFEMSGRYEQALYHYDRVLTANGAGGSIDETVRAIAACEPFRTPGIEALLANGAQNVEPPSDLAQPPDLETGGTSIDETRAVPAPCSLPRRDRGTVLVVASDGLAPHKRAVRLPIGAALVIAGAAIYGPGLGLSDSARANELAAKGLLTWINFPSLVQTAPRFGRVAVAVDGRPLPLERTEDVSRLAQTSWDAIKGTLMAAAIVRMITRAVAGEATQRGAEAGGAAGGIALLAGLAVQGALFAADTPDTRSWVTLPSRVHVARADVAPGKHRISVWYEGAAGRYPVEKTVDVRPGGFAVVTAASMR